MSAPSVQCFWSCLVMPRRWAGLCFHPFLTAPLPPPPSKRPTDPYTRIPPPQPTSHRGDDRPNSVQTNCPTCRPHPPPTPQYSSPRCYPLEPGISKGSGRSKVSEQILPPYPQTVANHIVSSCWRAVCVCTNMVLTWFYNKTQSVAYHRWSQSAARPGKASFYARNGQNMLDALIPTRERCLRPKVTPLLEQLPV